jgi:predicted transcriptional regulator
MSTVKLHIGGSLDKMGQRVIDAWHRAERGEAVEERHVTFESWEGLARIMTGKRLELLRHLHKHPASSIAELARALGRDYKRVHEDVEALSAAGLIDRDEEGLRAEYDEIETKISL